MLLVALGGAACTVIGSYFSARVGMGYGRDLRRLVFTHVEGFSLHEFDMIGTPSLITRTTNDITQVQNFAMMVMRMMIMAPIMAIGGVIMALQKDARLTWVLAVVIPIIAALIILVASRGIPLFRAIQAKIDRINLVLREGLTGRARRPRLQPGGPREAALRRGQPGPHRRPPSRSTSSWPSCSPS